jgi:transcriptional regulator with XRE-family HTH domain
MAAAPKYAAQRDRRLAPVVGIRHVRIAKGWSLDRLRDEILATTEFEVSVSQLNNAELGHRGASRELLEAWAITLGMDPADILTDWEPRSAPTSAGAA